MANPLNGITPKFRDYLLKNNIVEDEMCLSNIDCSFVDALGDEIKELEVSRKEYNMIIRWFVYLDCARVPYNWRGKEIWGIKLIIKESICEHEVDFMPEDPIGGAICKKCGERVYKPYTS